MKKASKDLSYTVKEYRMKGMPDPDSIWSDRQCLRAHATLGYIRSKNFLSLPRKNSRKSGTVFSRLINRENVSFLLDNTQSISDRAFRIQYFSSFVGEVCRMYSDNLKPQQYYREELIDLEIFRLFVQDKMLEFADVINESEDPSVRGMKEGMAAVRHGYINVICELLTKLGESAVYLPGDLGRLSGEVSISLINNLRWMSPADKDKIKNQIKGTIEKSSTETVKTNLVKTLETFTDSRP